MRIADHPRTGRPVWHLGRARQYDLRLVLVDSAERPEDIDRLRAQHAADAAKEALLQKQSIREYREARLTLSRAIARLHVKSLSEQ